MATFNASIHIDAPGEKVWAVLADLSAAQKYSPGVARSYYTSEQKEGIGAARHCDLVPFGEVEERITAWTPGQSYTLEIYDGKKTPPLKHAFGRFLMHPEGNGTRVTLAFEYDLKFGLFGALLNRLMVRRQFAATLSGLLRGLKHHVETGESIDNKKSKNLHYQIA